MKEREEEEWQMRIRCGRRWFAVGGLSRGFGWGDAGVAVRQFGGGGAVEERMQDRHACAYEYATGVSFFSRKSVPGRGGEADWCAGGATKRRPWVVMGGGDILVGVS